MGRQQGDPHVGIGGPTSSPPGKVRVTGSQAGQGWTGAGPLPPPTDTHDVGVQGREGEDEGAADPRHRSPGARPAWGPPNTRRGAGKGLPRVTGVVARASVGGLGGLLLARHAPLGRGPGGLHPAWLLGEAAFASGSARFSRPWGLFARAPSRFHASSGWACRKFSSNVPLLTRPSAQPHSPLP